MKLIFQEVKNFKSKFIRSVSSAKILEYVSLIKKYMYKITMHKRSQVALDTLTTEELNSFWQVLDKLTVSGVNNGLGDNIVKLKTEEPLYLLKIDSNIRAIIQVTAKDEIEVLDLVTQDTLKMFSRASK
ncbi:hypothetical protein DSM106972_088440 [Dulcicalothrix desertica PCC 7102]|uniref:Uncharacterized protein n=1 Tax=Dulcicalothrix desertica PCC 7102 TaxID=232991 RepID=A0A433UQR0_9CYAN|nr:hypothetical protein [Dulcicalothrix desertica]RUS96173.1 hypothetical protein DSM106972_088440 [Dulcicalothrix desertica PCC 7102]TWH53928.1 hypothetical protein CAL7102_01925 [Dulcicalothrix desertica PCC 7102]